MARDYVLGVIGVGNMGAALVRGVVQAGALSPEQIIISDTAREKAEALARDLGVRMAPDNATVTRSSDFVALVVKPWMMGPVLREIEPALSKDQALIYIAAGVSLHFVRQTLTKVKPCVMRVMPNTPAAVGAGMVAMAAPEATPERIEEARRILGSVGRVILVEESLMDAVTGLSGSGPAFVFLMIEALADGGVAAGLPRPVAQELAAQTVFGAAKMVLESGLHTAQLKDMVATPGGTTIAGLSVLEESGFRAALIKAVQAAARRAKELGEGK